MMGQPFMGTQGWVMGIFSQSHQKGAQQGPVARGVVPLWPDDWFIGMK